MSVDENENGELEGVIATAFETGRARWPGVELSYPRFRAHMLERVPEAAVPGDLLEQLCVEDLYLACACLEQRDPAIRAFESEMMPSVTAAVAHLDRGSGLLDEVRQNVRTMLLVDRGGRGPALADYAGRGALRRWVRVVATREAFRLLRQGKRHVGVEDEELFDAFAPAGEPSLSFIKKEAADRFREAFLAAVADLPRRERSALRFSCVHGLTIDEIAPLFDVHRATVARWIASARDTLLQATRKRLKKELELDDREVDSLIRFVQSRIDVSLHGALKSRGS